MIHAAVCAVKGTVLFRTWREASALWTRIVRAVSSHALILVPDHLHAQLTDQQAWEALRHALRGYALWRNAARGEHGPVFAHRSEPTPIRGRDHVERTRRYILLNACRKGLVDDPLAWPFSTLRDALGLALPAALRPVPDPAGFHRYVSADEAADGAGTPLPSVRTGVPATLAEIAAAVSALTRTSRRGLRERGPARRLFLHAARALTTASSSEIAAYVDIDASTVRRAPHTADAAVRLVERVLGDRRFAALEDGDLRRLPRREEYRHRR